jgi:tetratricopeptide (TPR) repeat protein
MSRERTHRPAASRLLAVLVALLALPLAPHQAAGEDLAAMKQAAEMMQSWDGRNIGDLYARIKQTAGEPGELAFDTIRRINQAVEQGRITGVDFAKMQANQRKAALQIRDSVDPACTRARQGFLQNADAAQKASVEGQSDIGSWKVKPVPDANTDIDRTMQGSNVEVNRAIRDQARAEVLKELSAQGTGLTAADFGVVLTAAGDEAEAEVFKRRGGIEWAERNMRAVEIVDLATGQVRRYEGQPGELVEILKSARELSTARVTVMQTGGQADYDKIFLPNGTLRPDIPQDMMAKYEKVLKPSVGDIYASRCSTAPGGILDMSEHLQKEVLDKPTTSEDRLKKNCKYVERANGIARRVPGLSNVLDNDPILKDYADVLALVKRVGTAKPAELPGIIAEKFGGTPDAGMQEFGTRSKNALARMAELAFQTEIDRIVSLNDPAERAAALDALARDFLGFEVPEFAALGREAAITTDKLSKANQSPDEFKAIQESWTSLKKLQEQDRSTQGKSVRALLEQTETGQKLLKHVGNLLEWASKPIAGTERMGFSSPVTEFIDDMRASAAPVTTWLGHATLIAGIMEQTAAAKDNAELAVGIGRALAGCTVTGMILEGAWAGIVHGDTVALSKTFMYLLLPESAVPAMVEALGNVAINMTVSTVFDSQLDAMYWAAKFDPDCKLLYIDSEAEQYTNPARMEQMVDELLGFAGRDIAQRMIKVAGNRLIAEELRGIDVLMRATVVDALRATVVNGNQLLFKEDGPLSTACARVARHKKEIEDVASVFGVYVPPDAVPADCDGVAPDADWTQTLDNAQRRALWHIVENRAKFQAEARKAFIACLVRTLEERERAERDIRNAKRDTLYAEMQKAFEDLDVLDKGVAAYQAECGYNILLKVWKAVFGTEHERLLKEMQALHKFHDAYVAIRDARNNLEELLKGNIGAAPNPRPLTGSLPLTLNPGLDTTLTMNLAKEVGGLADGVRADMERVKRGPLEGDYDKEMYARLYALRWQKAYWSNRRESASQSQALHWAIEVWDKQVLYNESDAAFKKWEDLGKQYDTLLEEFRKHYETGEYQVELTGPDSVVPNTEVTLTCVVRQKLPPKEGETEGEWIAAPAEVLKTMRFAWTSGTASLGEDDRFERKYKLTTAGPQEFGVTVVRLVTEAGKEKREPVGNAVRTVTVQDTEGPIKFEIVGPATGKMEDKLTYSIKMISGDLSKLENPVFSWVPYGVMAEAKEGNTFEIAFPARGNYEVRADLMVSNGAGGKVSKCFATLPVAISDLDRTVTITAPKQVMATDIFEMSVVLSKDLAAKAKYYYWSGATILEGQGTTTVKAQFVPSTFRRKIEASENYVFVYAKESEKGATVVEGSSKIIVQSATFGASGAGSWEGGGDALSFGANRKRAVRMRSQGDKQVETASASGSVNATWDVWEDFKTPEEIQALLEKSKGSWGRTNIRGISIGDFRGYMLEGKPSFGYRGNEWGYVDVAYPEGGASGYGFLIKGAARMKVSWSVSGGGYRGGVHPNYWWDDMPFVQSQVNAAYAEAQGIVSSLKIVPDGKLETKPYTGPALDGSDMPVVKILPAKSEGRVGQVFSFTCEVENAKPEDIPLQYAWSDGCDGKGKDATFQPTTAGAHTVSCTVTGARYGMGTGSAQVEAKAIKATVEKTAPEGDQLVVGVPVSLRANVTVDGQPVTGDVFYRWEPRELEFTSQDAPGNTTDVKFVKPGRQPVWVCVLQKQGDREVTLVESARLDLEVIQPGMQVTFDPAEPYVGQETKAKVVLNPDVPTDKTDFRWETAGQLIEVGESQDTRERTFIPKDGNDVSFTAKGRVPFTGEPLGEAKGTVKPKGYKITGSHRVIGPPVMVWKPNVGLVEEKQAIAVYQHVLVSATIEPAPFKEPVKWYWSVNEGSEIVSAPEGKEVTVQRTETGECIATVRVEDANKIVLGTGEVRFSASVSQQQVDEGKRKQQEAEDKKNIRIQLVAAKTRAATGEAVPVEVQITGAKPADQPIQYTWTGPIEGQGAKVQFKAPQAGKQTVRVAVKGARFDMGEASLDFDVVGRKVEVKLTMSGPIYVGQEIGLYADYTIDGVRQTTPIICRWESPDDVTLEPKEARGPNGKAIFNKMGPARVQVTVLDAPATVGSGTRPGPLLPGYSRATTAPQVLAVSEPLTVNVTGGQISLSIQPQFPWVGDEAKAIASTVPLINGVRYEWEVGNNGRAENQSEDTSQLGFSALDSEPLKVKVKATLAKSGEVIGQAETEVRARSAFVSAEVAGAASAPAKVWMQGVGLVDAADRFAEGQKIKLRANVNPQPKRGPARFEWSLDGGSAFEGPSQGAEVIVSRAKVGTGTGTVKAFDGAGALLGQASVNFNVLVSQEEVRQAEATAQAEQQRQQAQGEIDRAQQLAMAGKLQDAVDAARQAAQIDPAYQGKANQVIAQVVTRANTEGDQAIMNGLDFDAARKSFTFASELAPEDKQAKDGLAKVDTWQRAWDDAHERAAGLDDLAKRKRVVQAEKLAAEVKAAVAGIPCPPKLNQFSAEVDAHIAGVTEEYRRMYGAFDRDMRQTLYMEGNSARAIQLANKVLDGEWELRPGDESGARYMLNRAQSLQAEKERRIEDAITWLDKAIAMDTYQQDMAMRQHRNELWNRLQGAKALKAQGEDLEKQGKVTEAIGKYEQSVAANLDPPLEAHLADLKGRQVVVKPTTTTPGTSTTPGTTQSPTTGTGTQTTTTPASGWKAASWDSVLLRVPSDWVQEDPPGAPLRVWMKKVPDREDPVIAATVGRSTTKFEIVQQALDNGAELLSQGTSTVAGQQAGFYELHHERDKVHSWIFVVSDGKAPQPMVWIALQGLEAEWDKWKSTVLQIQASIKLGGGAGTTTEPATTATPPTTPGADTSATTRPPTTTASGPAMPVDTGPGKTYGVNKADEGFKYITSYPRNNVRMSLRVNYQKAGSVLDTVGLNAANVGSFAVRIEGDGTAGFWIYDPGRESSARTGSGWHVLRGKTVLAPNTSHDIVVELKGGTIRLWADGRLEAETKLATDLSGDPVYVGDFKGDESWGSGFNISQGLVGNITVVYFGAATATGAAPTPPPAQTPTGDQVNLGGIQWKSYTVGKATLPIPADWVTSDSFCGPGELIWYAGETGAAFAINRGGSAKEILDNLAMLYEGMKVTSQQSATVDGRAATSYIGTSTEKNMRGWVTVLSQPDAEGQLTAFVAGAPQDQWAKWSPIFHHIMGSVKLTGPAATTTGAAPRPKTVTVTALLENKATDNIHIYVAGESCDPSNRLTPGQTRTVPVKMGPDGRITFEAGRNGRTLVSMTWGGDPDHPDRYPHVVYTQDGGLLLTTGLR